eukprot:12207283-Alexandrium_andersonii.AAC.1
MGPIRGLGHGAAALVGPKTLRLAIYVDGPLYVAGGRLRDRARECTVAPAAWGRCRRGPCRPSGETVHVSAASDGLARLPLC